MRSCGCCGGGWAGQMDSHLILNHDRCYVMIRSIFISFAAALICCSCSSGDNPLETQQGALSPVVTGLWVTSPNNAEPIAAWGNPLSPDISPPSVSTWGYDKYGLVNPYPNPSSGAITITLLVPQSGLMRIWVSPVRLQGAGTGNAELFGGAVLNAANLDIIRELVNGMFHAGSHTYSWDGMDANGKPVPSGFYRIYAVADKKLYWHDVMIYRSPGDIPSSLRALIAN